jgi:hypothetical protein
MLVVVPALSIAQQLRNNDALTREQVRVRMLRGDAR